MPYWSKSSTFWQACRNAWHGVSFAIENESNIRRQVFIGVVAIILALLLAVPASSIVALLIIVTIVITLELINTALERLEDVVHPNFHIAIKHSKDVGAAAVMIASFMAVVAGLIILLPPLLARLNI